MLDDLLDTLPYLRNELEQLRADLNEQGAEVPPETTLGAALKKAGNQKSLVANIQKKTQKSVLTSLSVDDKATLRTGAGPGAGAFLMYPVDPECELEAPLWATAARRRLGLDHPAASLAELPQVSVTCANKDARGNTCSATTDSKGNHAAGCAPGGGRSKKHTALARAVGGLGRRWYQTEPKYEQRIPELDRQLPDGRLLTAKMDVVLNLPAARSLIDVTVRQGAAGRPGVRLAASRRDGAPSRAAEREKHARYPCNNLVAFVVEGCGRLGAEARTWLRTGASGQPGDVQVWELTRAHRVISAAVQGETARALRASAGLQ